jgi:potassium-transporting ATPase KdpC subunit
MRRFPAFAQHGTALRTLLLFTFALGFAYPLAITGIAQLPGLRAPAAGSLVTLHGRAVGSALIGQAFTDKHGNALVRYFQSRPSDAGSGYDPTASGASNLGPDSIVDTLGDPARAGSAAGDGSSQSLLTQVCSRSLAVGRLEGVSGARPYCTRTGVGAVLAVFHRHADTGPVTRVVSVNQECPATPFVRSYAGVRVQCAVFGADYARGVVTPIRGNAPETPAVPADAVTASGSGLDYQISPAYAELQARRVAQARGVGLAVVTTLIHRYESGRTLGFMGEPAVNVLELNIALDRQYPATTR